MDFGLTRLIKLNAFTSVVRPLPCSIPNYVRYFNVVNLFVLQSFRAHPVCLLPSAHAQTLPAGITLQAQPGERLCN